MIRLRIFQLMNISISCTAIYLYKKIFHIFFYFIYHVILLYIIDVITKLCRNGKFLNTWHGLSSSVKCEGHSSGLPKGIGPLLAGEESTSEPCSFSSTLLGTAPAPFLLSQFPGNSLKCITDKFNKFVHVTWTYMRSVTYSLPSTWIIEKGSYFTDLFFSCLGWGPGWLIGYHVISWEYSCCFVCGGGVVSELLFTDNPPSNPLV